MIDLVERLRALAKDYHQHRPHYTEAADEIERLERAYNQLRETYLQAYETYRLGANEIERLRAGLRMLITEEYDSGYSPETFADAVLSGHEPGK